MFDLSESLKIIAGMRRARPCVAPWGFVADTRGVAALELSLALPFMILLMMGVFDFGSYAYEKMQVNAAAVAGAQAAVAAAQNSQACTSNVITTAEQSATALGASIKTQGSGQNQGPNCAYTGYVNSLNGANTLSTTCTQTPCATPGQYAVAYAQLAYSPVLSWSGLVLPSTISATAMVRYG
jgi:Flp pilus assembly protein TadG